MRKLVTVRKVDDLRPIENADAIECATVEGWSVVVKKEEFKIGDLCVYFEIDSFLPIDDERFSFLAKNKITREGKEGVRLRTMKLRGQLSQGLILPIDLFPELESVISAVPYEELRERDFTELLKIEKWEAPIPACLSGEVVGGFPSFISKTDQERIQNLPEILENELDSVFEVSVKLDGSSMTVFYNSGEKGVCGRNWWLKETKENSLWRVANEDGLLDALNKLDRNLALQGELVGEGIQGNPEKLKGQAFFLFDIYDIDTGHYLGNKERSDVVEALTKFGASLKQVPILGMKTLKDIGADIDSLLEYADGPSLNPNTRREGLVFKEINGRISFKVISNWYLLKHSDR